MQQVPSSCTQALYVLAHGLMLCLGVLLLLEAELMIETVSDAPAKFLGYLLPAVLILHSLHLVSALGLSSGYQAVIITKGSSNT